MSDATSLSKSEKYLPTGSDSLAGAQEKTRFLLQETKILVGVPMYHQIYSLLNRAPEGGFTVQDVSKHLCINTKTCAKVLDEMVYKYKDIKVTAHRYGRVFVHKYQVKKESASSVPEQQKEYISMIRKEALEEIDTIPDETRKAVEQAISIDFSSKKRTSNRQRVTYQTLVRSLFILRKVLDRRIVSVNELKEWITHELEENAQWTLDRKTVIRLITKLQNAGLLNLMVFCISFNKTEGTKTEYLGSSFEAKPTDSSGNHTIQKVIVTVPEIKETDPEVVQNPMLTNPKHKKPIVITKNEQTPLKTRNKRLAAFITKQVKADDTEIVEPIEGDYMPQASRMEMAASWAFDFFQRLFIDRLQTFWRVLANPICPLALRVIFDQESKLRPLSIPKSEKLSMAYNNINLPKPSPVQLDDAEDNCQNRTIPEFDIYLPKKRLKNRQPSIFEAENAIKRVLLSLERAPENLVVEKDKYLNKGLDIPLQTLLEYFSLIGFAHIKGNTWNRSLN